MALEKLKWDNPWGPKKFRKIIELLIEAINARTPLGGLGISVTPKPDGAQISESGGALTGTVGGAAKRKGAGSSGASYDVYGVVNGARGTFHVLMSSAPSETP